MSTNRNEPQQNDGTVSSVPKSKKNRKEKPWDTDDIDHWKIEEIKPEEVQPFLEESSFSVLFPEYREKYIQECQGVVKKRMMEFGVKFELNLLEGSMTVRTTKKTWDPYAIIKARDVIKLISRSVPYQQALRVMEDGIFSEIIKIRSFVRNKERFIKRRQRLIGPNGDTLKALELLTECYILVQGSTVSIIGSFKNIKVLKRVIVDTMQNIHPIYHIKELMVKRELMKDEKMVGENWDRFLPKFKQVKVNRKKNKKASRAPKEYNPFPPEQQPRIEDIKMETGEYFLSEKEQHEKQMELKRKKQERKRLEKQDAKEENEERQEQQELKREKQRERAKAQKKMQKESKAQASVDELKQKFLTKPVKQVKF